MTELVVSRRARDDLKRIWRYIALDNANAADKLLLALEVKVARLKTHPEIGAPRDEIRPGARVLVHGSYLILYEFCGKEDVVEVVAIVEGRRDLGHMF